MRPRTDRQTDRHTHTHTHRDARDHNTFASSSTRAKCKKNLSTVKWAQWDKTHSRELLVCYEEITSLSPCVCDGAGMAVQQSRCLRCQATIVTCLATCHIVVMETNHHVAQCFVTSHLMNSANTEVAHGACANANQQNFRLMSTATASERISTTVRSHLYTALFLCLYFAISPAIKSISVKPYKTFSKSAII